MSGTTARSEDETLDLRDWHQRVAQTFAPAEVAPDSSSFSGRMRTFDFGALRVSHIQATSHVLERSSRHIGSHPESNYVLCLQLEGRAVVTQGGNSAILGPGDATIYNTARPYSFTFDTEIKNLGVVMPHAALSLSPRLVDELTARRLDGELPATGASLNAISEYERGIRSMPASVRPRVQRTILDLFETLCLSHSSPPDGRSGEHAALWSSVVEYIDAHLSDPDLNPARIAAENYLSLRSLHSLGAEAGTTVAGCLRQRRLEACRVDLVDPTLAHLSAADIGARRGLANPPHFTTLFRRAYGTTPAAYRRAASVV